MKHNRNEYQWKPSVLGSHYIDHVTRSASSDPLLVTKKDTPISTWWIVVGIVVLLAIGFSDVIF